MNAAKDRTTRNILGYIEGAGRATHISRSRFTKELTIKVTPEMCDEIDLFANRHGVNRSEAVRAMIQRSMADLDKELTRKARNLAR